MTSDHEVVLEMCFMDIMTKNYGLVGGNNEEIATQLVEMGITMDDCTGPGVEEEKRGLYVFQDVDGGRVPLFAIMLPQANGDGTMIVRHQDPATKG